LIAESYDLMKRGLGLSAEQLGEIYRIWNTGPLASFLIEITAEIFHKKDEETGKPLVEVILDKASQKGTGKWTSQEALDLGVPIPTISAAVEARSLSAYKSEREAAARIFPALRNEIQVERDEFVSALGEALYASTLITYIQGIAESCQPGVRVRSQLERCRPHLARRLYHPRPAVGGYPPRVQG
jgi:6-phosphogluconate dehydrogenase